MGILSILGMGKAAGDAIASPVEAVGNVLDKLFTSDEERGILENAKAKLAMQPSLAQIEINKIEASHRSIFVAGWRPFIGWVCGCGLAWHFIVHDFLVWLTTIMAWPAPPELIGTKELISLVLALLGLGGLRTFEKLTGRSK